MHTDKLCHKPHLSPDGAPQWRIFQCQAASRVADMLTAGISTFHVLGVSQAAWTGECWCADELRLCVCGLMTADGGTAPFVDAVKQDPSHSVDHKLQETDRVTGRVPETHRLPVTATEVMHSRGCRSLVSCCVLLQTDTQQTAVL